MFKRSDNNVITYLAGRIRTSLALGAVVALAVPLTGCNDRFSQLHATLSAWFAPADAAQRSDDAHDDAHDEMIVLQEGVEMHIARRHFDAYLQSHSYFDASRKGRHAQAADAGGNEGSEGSDIRNAVFTVDGASMNEALSGCLVPSLRVHD